MRWRSPSYSPPRRGHRSPPRGRYNRHRDPPCGLLVRNIPKDSRPEEIRSEFEHYGRIRDVYLPKDFHSGEPRGFGFVQFLDAHDASEAKRHMDRAIFKGREISVVFAEENRKRPDEMRVKERSRGRMSYGGYKRSPYHGRSMSRSPRHRSPSPRGGRYSRSNNATCRGNRHGSLSSSPDRSRSRSSSPDTRRKGRRGSSPDRSRSRSPKDGKTNVDSHMKGGRHSVSPAKSSSPQANGRAKSPLEERRNSRSRSFSNESERSSRSLRKYSRSRSKSWRESRSPRSPSPPSRRRHSPLSRLSGSRESPDPAKKAVSSPIPEARNGDSQVREKS
eukprot:c12099_g1_i1 orf=212-1210(+)